MLQIAPRALIQLTPEMAEVPLEVQEKQEQEKIKVALVEQPPRHLDRQLNQPTHLTLETVIRRQARIQKTSSII